MAKRGAGVALVPTLLNITVARRDTRQTSSESSFIPRVCPRYAPSAQMIGTGNVWIATFIIRAMNRAVGAV